MTVGTGAGEALLQDVAKLAGVSVATASRVLNKSGYTSERSSEKVEQAAKKLGYRPNIFAKALRSARSGLIGLLIPDLKNEYYNVMASAIQRHLSEKNLRLIVTTAEDADNERKALEALNEQRVDGIIHVPIAPTPPIPAGMKVVQLNRTSGGDVPGIICDEVQGFTELTKLVAQRAHSSVALIIGEAHHSTTQARARGFHIGLNDSGLNSNVYGGEFSSSWGYEATKLALEAGADAIISASPRLAVGAVQALQEGNVSVPEQAIIASYSDPEWFSLWHPGMTTLAPPLEDMGNTAVDRLLSIIDGDSSATDEPVIEALSGTIIERGSTARS